VTLLTLDLRRLSKAILPRSIIRQSA